MKRTFFQAVLFGTLFLSLVACDNKGGEEVENPQKANPVPTIEVDYTHFNAPLFTYDMAGQSKANTEAELLKYGFKAFDADSLMDEGVGNAGFYLKGMEADQLANLNMDTEAPAAIMQFFQILMQIKDPVAVLEVEYDELNQFEGTLVVNYLLPGAVLGDTYRKISQGHRDFFLARFPFQLIEGTKMLNTEFEWMASIETASKDFSYGNILDKYTYLHNHGALDDATFALMQQDAGDMLNYDAFVLQLNNLSNIVALSEQYDGENETKDNGLATTLDLQPNLLGEAQIPGFNLQLGSLTEECQLDGADPLPSNAPKFFQRLLR